MKPTKTLSTLIYGCDIISKRLKFCLCPMGWLFEFKKNRPKPLPVVFVLSVCFTIMMGLLVDFTLIRHDIKNSHLFDLARESIFVVRLYKIYEIYRVSCYMATILIILTQHGAIANVIAMKNNLVSRKQQSHYAKLSFTVYFIISIAKCFSFVPFFENLRQAELGDYLRMIFIVKVLIFLHLTISAPLIYTCFMGCSLGKHVENFSEIYVETMFDQFMKAIENEEERETALGYGDGSDDSGVSRVNSLDEDGRRKKRGLFRFCFGCFAGIFKYFRRVIARCGFRIRRIAAHLNSRKYPELPEMKMSKLSSTTNLKISEAMRASNSRLIGARLRKTQNMLSELRDVVSDINKMSSPLIMLQIIYDTVLIVLISNVSIQSKLYKSISLLILPTIATTICLSINVVYICICMDETTSQLKLMMNKLFDFIIMNHRVHSSSLSAGGSTSQLNGDLFRHVAGTSGDHCSRILGPIGGREDEQLSETWSQFQYTRKLANTIHFTMGGILPISRRLVLTILGHILSVVFISIEIMSIVDTSGAPHQHGK